VTRRAIRAGFAAAVAAAGLSATALSAAAAPGSQLEAAPASSIRAGMLVNFVKFTDWPPESGAGTQLTLCVVDDPAVAEALETMTRGRSIERRQLVLKRMKLDGPLAECQLLYVAGVNRDKTRQLLARVKDAPVFTVSDFEEFAPLGGVVHFFVQGGRMRFAVNPAAAQRARLKLSSQLLGVATIVKDEHAH
jgi:hypothetical protein